MRTVEGGGNIIHIIPFMRENHFFVEVYTWHRKAYKIIFDNNYFIAEVHYYPIFDIIWYFVSQEFLRGSTVMRFCFPYWS